MESVTYKGMLWGHNTNEMRIDHVDTFALNNQVENAVSEYGQAWNIERQKLFEKARTAMQEKLTSSIGEFERKVMSTSFKDTYYRNLIINALDELRDHQELAIGDTITRYQRQGCDIASNQFYPTGTYELKEEQVGSFLSRILR